MNKWGIRTHDKPFDNRLPVVCENMWFTFWNPFTSAIVSDDELAVAGFTVESMSMYTIASAGAARSIRRWWMTTIHRLQRP